MIYEYDIIYHEDFAEPKNLPYPFRFINFFTGKGREGWRIIHIAEDHVVLERRSKDYPGGKRT